MQQNTKTTYGKRGVSPGFAISIIILIAVISIVVVLMAQLNSDQRTEFGSKLAGSKVNETLVTVNEAGEFVTQRIQCGFQSFSVLAVTNATSGTLIQPGNYTVTSDGKVRFSSASASHFNGTNWNVTYTYRYGDVGCNTTLESDKAFNKVSSNLDLVGLAVAFGLVLTLILGAIYFKKNSGF